MKKILFNGLGNRGWIGGLYYLKNIIFSCLESEKIKKEYRIVVLIDSAHADIFTCFGNRIDLHIYDGTNKAKLALYEMNLIWLHGVKYCYALELNKIGSLFASRGIFWIPDFQHKTLPEFFQPVRYPEYHPARNVPAPCSGATGGTQSQNGAPRPEFA